jgi:glutamine synthetase
VALETDAVRVLAELRERLPAEVTSVRVTYADLHGVQRGKDVPVDELHNVLEKGLAFCWAVMGTDLRHTPVVGGEAGYPDMIARMDPDTLVQVPWEPSVAVCLADLERALTHEREPTDPRDAVRRAVAAFAELGYVPVVGPELEFFLLRQDPTVPGGARRNVDTLSMVYTVGAQADPNGVVRALLEGCAGLGLGAFAANHEFMNSQYEINLRESEALSAADRAFRLKSAVKDAAAQRGLLATFMGKPFNDQGGSGFHIHISLARDGENAFPDPDDDRGVAAELRHFTAGVIAHAHACMAFLNPTVNAYRRILPDSLAPTHANWGFDNRTTYVRIPPERGGSTRLEVRVGDGASNPYLGIAAVLFAGLDGVRRRLDPGEPLAGDAYTLPPEQAGAPLPATLDEALDALEADEVLVEALGRELVETFVAVKRFEAERHRMHVSEWELEEYLQHL